jgi:hypothetical protein
VENRLTNLVSKAWCLLVGVDLILAAVSRSSAQELLAPPDVIRWTIEVANESGHGVPNGELWVVAPRSIGLKHERTAMDASMPFNTMEDCLGNTVMHFALPFLPPGGQKLISISCTLLGAAAPRTDGCAAERYLQPEKMIEFDQPEFASSSPAPLELKDEATVRHWFDYVVDHVKTRPLARQDRGAIYALLKGEGDCTESACLLASLLRREGIPARVVGGYVLPGSAVLDPVSFHEWVEYCGEGSWRIADPYDRRMDAEASDYVSFRERGESDTPLGEFSRFRCTGDGLQVRMVGNPKGPAPNARKKP